MDLETQRAVEESVRHWGRILALVPGESPEASQCALCKKFDVSLLPCVDEHGESCPIKERTGVDGCGETPWADANSAYIHMRYVQETSWPERQESAIRKELGWVKSFLPTLRPIPYV